MFLSRHSVCHELESDGATANRGLINLNWRLIQMPLHLVDYVVVHELSHLIEMNHSASFRKLVGSVYFDYQTACQERKDYA
tara:strand:+ start:173 stop:415 length:243 start_codon:yes stop_codon:yes gene_type:complete